MHGHLSGTLVVVIVTVGKGGVQHCAVFVDGHVGVSLAVDGQEFDEEAIDAGVGRREDAGLGGVAVAHIGDDVVKVQNGVDAHGQTCDTVVCGKPHGEGHWRERTRCSGHKNVFKVTVNAM